MALANTPYRGTRRTRFAAKGVAVAALFFAAGLGGAVGATLWSSMHGQQDTVPLMQLDADRAAVEAVTVEAPSRKAPTLSIADATANPPHTAATPRAKTTAQPSPAKTVVTEVTTDAPTFDGRPLRPVRTLTMRTTAYSPDERSCGNFADGITASGYSVWTNAGKLVAADTDLLPFGTLVSIPGYHDGKPVPVLDRGAAIKGHRLDLLYPTHDIALQWGVQNLEVVVWEYAD